MRGPPATSHERWQSGYSNAVLDTARCRPGRAGGIGRWANPADDRRNLGGCAMPSVRAMVGVVAVGRGATGSRGRALTIVANLLLLAMASMPAADAAQTAPGGGPFTTFGLAGTPPAPAEPVCPRSGSACTHLAAEP